MKLCIMKNSRLLILKMTKAFSNYSLKIPENNIFCEKSKVFFFLPKTLRELNFP